MPTIDADIRARIESDPFCETLGIELVALESGSAQTTLTVTDDLLNFHGTPHGGSTRSLMPHLRPPLTPMATLQSH
nr:hypothetical protein [Halovenus rubra]